MPVLQRAARKTDSAPVFSIAYRKEKGWLSPRAERGI